MDLDRSDLDTLIDAVEKWETGDSSGELVGSLLGAMMCKDETQFREMESKRDAERKKQETAKKVRRERGVLLRAKLIRLRDSMDTEKLFADAAS